MTKMQNNLEHIADLLMYSGPSMSEIIKEATEENLRFEISQTSKLNIIKVTSYIPYEIKVIDSYVFNKDDQLIKHTVKINNKEKVVFDKYGEAAFLLNNLNKENTLVS